MARVAGEGTPATAGARCTQLLSGIPARTGEEQLFRVYYEQMEFLYFSFKPDALNDCLGELE